MAIALEVGTSGDPLASPVSGGSGANRTMIFLSETNSGSDSITGVTWNSEAFTKIGSVQSGAARFLSAWYLIPTGTGSQAWSITGTGCCNTSMLVYTGTNQAAPKNLATESGSTSGAVDIAVTANNGDWLVGMAISNVGAVTTGANTTIRSAAGSNIHADSNAAASPTALNFSLASSGAYALLGFALAPAGAASGTDNLTLLGVS